MVLVDIREENETSGTLSAGFSISNHKSIGEEWTFGFRHSYIMIQSVSSIPQYFLMMQTCFSLRCCCTKHRMCVIPTRNPAPSHKQAGQLTFTAISNPLVNKKSWSLSFERKLEQAYHELYQERKQPHNILQNHRGWSSPDTNKGRGKRSQTCRSFVGCTSTSIT